MDNAHLAHAITASLVPEHQRTSFLPSLFGQGILALKGEAQVYYALTRLCKAYDGGYWHFYQLPNGGAYMAPSVSAERLLLECLGSQTEILVSLDAAGIIATIFALSHMSNDPEHSVEQLEHLINRFYQLRQFALNHHPEAGLIYQAID